eukprot:Hpha_TRINITY_DN15247_c5_g1::TRINITY_DN15247_c5_g1_i2::g.64878::m.64878
MHRCDDTLRRAIDTAPPAPPQLRKGAAQLRRTPQRLLPPPRVSTVPPQSVDAPVPHFVNTGPRRGHVPHRRFTGAAKGLCNPRGDEVALSINRLLDHCGGSEATWRGATFRLLGGVLDYGAILCSKTPPASQGCREKAKKVQK